MREFNHGDDDDGMELNEKGIFNFPSFIFTLHTLMRAASSAHHFIES
jgi:hypothetical protein